MYQTRTFPNPKPYPTSASPGMFYTKDYPKKDLRPFIPITTRLQQELARDYTKGTPKVIHHDNIKITSRINKLESG